MLKTISVTAWLPKLTGNHSFFEYLYDMADGKMEGMFVMGQNPAVGAPNSRLQRTALAKLKWLVVRDMVEIEAATFLARLAGNRARRIEDGRHRDRSFLFPGGRSRRKRRRIHEHAAPFAVARKSGGPARRLRVRRPGSCISSRCV